MDPVPPLYIHLTSKLRLSSRLQHLRDGILEGKGLSQFHSAKEAEIEQQYDAEEDPGREPEDDSYPAEFSQTSPIELCEETDGKETQPAEEHSQSDALSLPRPSQASEPRDLNKDDEDPGNDIAEALPDTNKTEEEALNADNDSSKAALTTGEVTAAPSPPLPSEDPQQVLDEPTIDDGDFVDYEDEEDLAHGTSSGSSTLQGDVREVATEQDVSEVPRPTAEFQELQMPPDAQESTTQEDGIRRSLVNGQDINAAADTRSVGPSDTVKEDLEYLNYPNEDNASSSDELLEEGEDYIEDDEDAGNLQKDQLELSDNANMDQDATLSQPKGESISYEVEEPQEQADQDPKDRKPSDGAPLGLDIEEQLPSHPIEDEYDFGPTSPQEEQAALDDLDKNNQPVKGEMKQADATDDHTAKATLEPPILDRAVEHDEHDDDEITYEDENNVESPQEPFHAERDIASSPGSLKRVRSLDEDDGAPEDDLQGELPSREIRFKYYGVLIAFPTGAKRVRSE